jgi:hypothetical protein
MVTHEGEGQQPVDRWLTFENEAIREFVNSLPRDTWLLILGGGSHEQARLEVLEPAELAGTSAASPARAVAATPAPRPAAPAGPARPVAGPRVPEPLSHNTWHALQTAHEIVDLYRQKYGAEPSDAVLRLAAGLQIEHNRSGRPISRDPE